MDGLKKDTDYTDWTSKRIIGESEQGGRRREGARKEFNQRKTTGKSGTQEQLG